MLESLARCLTELCAFDFFWNFLSFWPFSFIILASLSISSVFSSMCQVSVNPQNLDILRAIIKSLSYQVINTLTFNQPVFCYYQKFAKNHYERENFSVSCDKELTDSLFKFRQDRLGSTIYLVSSGIFRDFDFIRLIRMISCSFKHGRFLKPGGFVFINNWSTKMYTLLLFGQNKSKLKICHWLELGCSCKLKQWTTRETWLVVKFWCRC